jgi:hypothetical protein
MDLNGHCLEPRDPVFIKKVPQALGNQNIARPCPGEILYARWRYFDRKIAQAPPRAAVIRLGWANEPLIFSAVDLGAKGLV